MKNKAFFIGFAAILGVIAAVVLVNMMMVDGPVGPDGKKTTEFKMLDSTVENLMLNVFKSPPPVSNHGKNVDRMIVFVHILMAILFVGWSLYFLAALIKFNSKSNPKADYHGVRSKVGTTVAEYGVILVEVVLIACFAVPLWADVVNEEQIEKIKAASKEGKGNGLELHILAKQYDWNARYAGNDGRFEEQALRFANKVDNPFGINPEKDDVDDVIITTARSKDNAIVVPWDRPVALKMTSMDVIHSFKVLPLRVCKDCIPGLQLPIHFKVNSELLNDKNGKPANKEDDEHLFLITCAQLCGDGHGYMNGYLKVVHPDKFDDWLETKSRAELEKRKAAKINTDLAANNSSTK